MPMVVKLPVLVIGAGMYVTGRGTNSFGTILPTLMTAQSEGLIGDIRVAATTSSSIDDLKKRVEHLNHVMGLRVDIKGYPSGVSKDERAYQKALEDLPSPACAIISVPDNLHTEISADVIKSGVHPLVVKPLAPTLKEAQYLIELTEIHKVYGAVEFHKRFDESNLVLRQALKEGKLGSVRYVTVEYSQRRLIRDIFGSWLNKTNIFQYLGIHYVDLVWFLTKAVPIRVLATSQKSDSGNSQNLILDAIQAIVEWKDTINGNIFTTTIITNWIDPDKTSAMSDQKITVVGTDGRYQLDQKNRGAQLVTQNGGVEDVNPYFTQIYHDAVGRIGVHGYGPASITQFLTDVTDLVNGEVTRENLIDSRPSFQDCLISTAVIEAVNTSLSRQGDWVYLEGIMLDG